MVKIQQKGDVQNKPQEKVRCGDNPKNGADTPEDKNHKKNR